MIWDWIIFDEWVIKFVKDSNVCIILKGYWMFVIDGEWVFYNWIGNLGMVIVGVGDVLIGVLIGLIV